MIQNILWKIVEMVGLDMSAPLVVQLNLSGFVVQQRTRKDFDCKEIKII